jgi:hypothetical protein
LRIFGISSSYTKELRAALVDLGHKSAFDLLLKEAWNPEVAALGNSTLPTVCDKTERDVVDTSEETHCHFGSRESATRFCNRQARGKDCVTRANIERMWIYARLDRSNSSVTIYINSGCLGVEVSVVL